MNPMNAATTRELRRLTALTCRPWASLIICADSIESTAARAIWSLGSCVETSPSCWVDVARIWPHDADAVALSMDDRFEPLICWRAPFARSIVLWSWAISACSATIRALSCLRLMPL